MSFYGFGVIRKSLVFTLLQSAHILSDFQVGNFSINLCRTNVAVPEHLTERLHCHTVGKADGRGESVASHVKSQAILYLAYLTNVYTGERGLADVQCRKYQLIGLLPFYMNIKYLLCDGQKWNDGFHVRLLPFDAYLTSSVIIMVDMPWGQSQHIHTSQSREGTENEELPCPLELLVDNGRLQNAVELLRCKIPSRAVWLFRLEIHKRVSADVFFPLPDAYELSQEDNRHLNGGG